jgi:hypothetical protein
VNDILLTDYGAIVDKATSEWMNGKGEGMTLEGFTSRAICRAQLRKVVEWAEKHNVGGLDDIEGEFHPMGILYLGTADLAALKAAGEGK